MSLKIKLLSLALIAILFSGCVSKSKHESLVLERDSLENLLFDCQNGEERILAFIQKHYRNQDYSSVLATISELEARHPQSLALDTMDHFKNMVQNMLDEKRTQEKEKAKIAAEERAKKEEEDRKKRERNKTGLWRVQYYVDEFGERTSEQYITHAPIEGAFSNSATTNSLLRAQFLITSKADITLMLYGYGDNQVKAYSSTFYDVLVQDSEGNRYRMTAVNRSDRLSFDKDSYTLHKIFDKGGMVKFSIKESRYPVNSYSFSLPTTNYYSNAYRIMLET